MVTFPNAKINIGLDILRRRPDGYHDVETVMVPVPWCDILEVVPAKDDSDTLVTTGRSIGCPPEKNLVMKAIGALREIVTFPAVEVHLHKIIPDGAGLGGGSADAAFAVRTVNEEFALGLTDADMAGVAGKLGADCPFFIYNVPMLCTGTGTDLSPISISLPEPLWIAIVKPQVSVPTKDAYAHVKPEVPATSLSTLLHNIDFSQWQGAVKNDFEQSVFELYPRIAEVKQRLLSMGATYAAMSGSGSAVFALFTDGDAGSGMSAAFPDCDIIFKPFSIG